MDRRRVYSALVFFPCFYILVRYLPAPVFFVFVAAGILLAQYEYYRFYFSERWTSDMGWGLALGLGVTILFAVPGLGWSELGIIGITIGVIVLAPLLPLKGRDLKTGLQNSAVLAFGILYIPGLLGHMISIRQLGEGSYLIFFLFLVTWANDTTAYYVGRNWGRHKMAPVVSPNKTLEGGIGGVVGSVVAALICRTWFLQSLSFLDALAIGLLLGIAAPLGDLFESLLKRRAGVKDSGALIPGHGGILDRVDSLIFTTPTFYYYLLAMRTP